MRKLRHLSTFLKDLLHFAAHHKIWWMPPLVLLLLLLSCVIIGVTTASPFIYSLF